MNRRGYGVSGDRRPDGSPLDPAAAHARFYSEWRDLDSFATLSPLQRAILQDILMDFTRVNGNRVRLTCKGMQRRYQIGHRTARVAIAGLEERGWIDRIGLSPGPTGQAGGEYEIMCISPRGARVSGPYMRWRMNRASSSNRSVD